MGRMGIALALAALAGCTSVKMVQREGCWVKRTEKWPGRESEELAFCTKPPPVWSQDRLARLVQECVAQADYRWENRAIAAWTRGEPVPAPESDETISKTCMSEAALALGLEEQNAALKMRLSDLSQDRDVLRSVTEKDRDFLKQSNGEMVSALGEAAKKPAPAAVATATSTGTATTESDVSNPAAPAPAGMTVVGFNGAPAPVPAPQVVVAPANAPKVAKPCTAVRKPIRSVNKGKAPAADPGCADQSVPPAKPQAAEDGPVAKRRE
jgi:hypothetical protein